MPPFIERLPYARVLACVDIDFAIKKKLKSEHVKLNPFELKRQIAAVPAQMGGNRFLDSMRRAKQVRACA